MFSHNCVIKVDKSYILLNAVVITLHLKNEASIKIIIRTTKNVTKSKTYEAHLIAIFYLIEFYTRVDLKINKYNKRYFAKMYRKATNIRS